MPNDEWSRTPKFVNPARELRHIAVHLEDFVPTRGATDQAYVPAAHPQGRRHGGQRRLGRLAIDGPGGDLDDERRAAPPAPQPPPPPSPLLPYVPPTQVLAAPGRTRIATRIPTAVLPKSRSAGDRPMSPTNHLPAAPLNKSG